MFMVRVETQSLPDAAVAATEYLARLFALALSDGPPRPGAPRVVFRHGPVEQLLVPTPSPEDNEVRVTVMIPASDFFSRQFLRDPSLPLAADTLAAAATAEGFDGLCESPAPRTLQLGFDLVAAVVWFLGRHEEYLISERDQHGRFTAAQSRAPRSLYAKPVISHILWQLRRRILATLGQDDPFHPMRCNAPVAISHDVDLMRKYRGPLSTVRRTLGVALRHGFGETVREAAEALAVLAGRRRDPYDSFAELMAAKERMDIRGTWFFQAGGTTHHDCDYQLSHRDVRALISEAKAWGDEIGIHPSYQNHTAETLRTEIAALAKVSGSTPAGARMHYLRLNIPETWKTLATAGITYDATAAFPDLNGFRCGWSGPFRPLDLRTMQEVPIVAIPLTAMDITLAVYEKISPEHSLEILSALLDAAHVPNGCFSFLWHNTMFDTAHYGPYWGTFEYFLYAGGSSMSFRPLGEFAKGYLHREQAAYAAATGTGQAPA
jgi:hypothetical protein